MPIDIQEIDGTRRLIEVVFIADAEGKATLLSSPMWENIEGLSLERHVTMNAEDFVKKTNLKVLFIRGNSISNDSFQYLTNLSFMAIYDNQQLTDEAFQYLTNLTYLKIIYCKNITNKAFQHLPNLTDLDITNCTWLTNEAFQYLTNLKHLTLTDCDRVTNEAFHYLPNLTYLNIGGLINITNEAFEYLPKLERLQISGNKKITDEAFQYLTNLTALQITNNYAITDKAFEHLRHLKRLNIYGDTRGITPMALVPLYGAEYIEMHGRIGTPLIGTPLEVAIGLRHLAATAGIIANQVVAGTVDPDISDKLGEIFNRADLAAAIRRASAPLAAKHRMFAETAFLKRRELIAAPHGRNLLLGRPVNFEMPIEHHPLIAPATGTNTAATGTEPGTELNLFGNSNSNTSSANTPSASSSGGSRSRSRSRRYKKSRRTRRNKSIRRIKRTKRTKRTKSTRKMVKKN